MGIGNLSKKKGLVSAVSAEDLNYLAERVSVPSPYIGDNGNWYVWDASVRSFVDTGLGAVAKDGYEDEIDSYLGESGKFKLYKIVSPKRGYMYSEWTDYYILTINQKDGTGLGSNIVQYRLSFDGVTKRTRQRISVNPAEFAWTEWEKDGGYTPQKGVDYWTDEDIAEIKSYVDEAILGGEW